MTKRAFPAFLTLLALLAPLTAHAGHWVQREIKWRISGVGPTGSSTGIWVRDTLYNALGGTAGGDTTADFTLDYASVPPRGLAPPAGQSGSWVNVTGTGAGPVVQQDTTTVAWVVIQQDTAVAFTPTATSVTMLVDGKVGGYGVTTTLGKGWVKADSAFINGAAGGTLTTGDESVAIPIRTVSPYGNIFRWDRLRARISPATGTMAGARVFVRYWTDSDVESQDR